MKNKTKQGCVMKKLIIIVLIAVFLINLSGCATIMLGLEDRNRKAKVYPATFANGELICECCSEKGAPFLMGYISGWARIPVILANTVDLPISITSDTLLLPVDVYRWNLSNKLTEPIKKQKQEQNQTELKTDM